MDAAEAAAIYRSLFAAYADALLLVEPGGGIVLANPAASELLGYSPEELVSLSVDALVPDAIRPRHAAYREGYAKHPRARPMGTQMELVARRKDGSEVMVEIALSPLQGQGLPYVVAAIRDIGAYPRVKQALKRARYAEHVAEVGAMAVDTRDPQQLLQRIPQVAAEALQADAAVVFLLETDRQAFRVAGCAGDLLPEHLGAQVPNRPDTPPGFVVAQGCGVLVTDYATEQRFAVPSAYVDAGLVSALAVPLTDRGQSVGALTVRSRQAGRFGDDEMRFLQSLAHLLAASLQRTQTEEALQHAQRLESVGQLTGGIAHDFNNLLTIIQGNLQVLEDVPAVADDANAPQLVGAAMRASKRGAELTGKLLAFSRRQVLQPTRVDVPALLESLADMLRRTLDQRIQITVQVQPGCPPCLADPGQLESALLNIAINARDAMPDGGALNFAAQRCEALPAAVLAELQDSRPQAYVQIAIGDTGTGMPDIVKERAFEPFFTTKEAGRGTGLGLSTVYGFAKQSRGAALLDSTLGEGTTVSLLLPCHPDAAGAEAATVAAGDAVPAGLRVLLVEDEPEVRAVVMNFLRTLGCEVQALATAEAALEELAADAGYRLLLSDIALGAGLRGTQLAALAQQRQPALAVLLMSGYSSELLDANEASAWELLRKPFTREDLARAIARVLNAPRPVPPR
ncbi:MULTISPECIES: PAS domain S-box protein [Roseateles]|uniref:histidine kinase n=1 Tax=Pelomonas aquatica TaxID=431058 RepID=A0ABU1ZEU7_9BURK|nr:MULTISPECIES: PAS domain S-box protein [Roseateles]KQY86863.1 histidine kinase [Pelomonas sp. Root1444]MDR7299157.1 PAS domain S-box-containing protein [Pelomonas aquatica]